MEFEAELKRFGNEYPETSKKKMLSDKFFYDFYRKLYDRREDMTQEFGFVYKDLWDGLGIDEQNLYMKKIRESYEIDREINELGFDLNCIIRRNISILDSAEKLGKFQGV